MKKEMTCVICPMGCLMNVQIDEQTKQINVAGNACLRGEKYAREEMIAPRRILTTTVLLERAELPRLPVVSDGAIPKEKLMDAMVILNRIKVKAPIRVNDVIVKNICQSGVDIIASRTILRKTK